MFRISPLKLGNFQLTLFQASKLPNTRHSVEITLLYWILNYNSLGHNFADDNNEHWYDDSDRQECIWHRPMVSEYTLHVTVCVTIWTTNMMVSDSNIKKMVRRNDTILA
jgi:hypothetical protein